ncbi:hypothetical protein Tco_1018713 [Tanacetum coccineum]|uniref:Retrovirus-related Pol polyprotein from transposon TNT 1-94 n=1 Tax=Tanacetum coccineum TaxID=301880 RepID=A0ABQ5FWH3_9ASTR
MEDRIFFNQSKYIKEMLKKFGLEDSKPTKMPMSTEIKLTKDDEADSVDSSKYRGIGYQEKDKNKDKADKPSTRMEKAREYESKGNLKDKILVPVPDSSQRPLKIEIFCLDCGDPVHGLYCRQCALIRKTLEEVFQDFQDTSKSSDDDTNFVNQEPFVMESFVNESSDYTKPEPWNLVGKTLLSVHPTSCSGDENSFTYDSKPNFVDDSPNIFNPPPQPPMYSCEFCGNDARYGHYCTPQVLFIYPEPGYNQDFNFPQDFHDFQQQYLCCENCGGPHETYHCQPMNEDYYHKQNSCYDYNSFGFDQFQPPQYTINHPISNVQNSLFNAQNEFLNSQNKLMEQMTSICDMVGQYMQKKEEEKRIAEEQAAKDRYWKIPICYDDDEDYTIAITPVLPTKEPVNSLSMGDEHLDTIPATESDEVIKSSVENLVPIPSESEGIPDSVCDVPLCNNPTPLEAFKEHSETIIDSNNDYSSSDDDSYENIDYVDASPPDSEIVSLEVVEIVIPKVGGIDDDILLTIKDDILREKLLNVNLLIANIEALKDNPAPSSDVMTKSSSTSLNLFLEETNTFDNSSPESETFCFDLEENSSGSTTTRSDYSLPDYEAFYDNHIEEKSSGSTTTHADFSQYDSFIFDLSINPFPPVDRSDFYHEEFADELAHIISPPEYDHFCFKIEPELGNLTMDAVGDIFPTREPRVHVPNVLPTHPTLNLDLDLILFSEPLFAYIVWIFLPFLTYPVAPPYLLSCGNEDTIFDPGISIYHSFMPGVSHRSGTFMKFNVYPNHLNESPMKILSSTCSPMDQ